MEPDEALVRSLACAGRIIKAVDPVELDRPTPCPEWSLRQLLNHVLSQLRGLEGRLTATSVPNTTAPGVLPPRDLVGPDPADAYEEVAVIVRSAAQEPLTLGAGNRSTDAHSAEVLVHAWDVARATGQAGRFDDELASHCLAVLRTHVAADGRDGLFGAEVAVAESATPMEQLVAFCGRVP